MYVGYINTIHKRCVVLDQQRAGNDLAWWRVGTWCLATWRHISSSNKIQKKLLVFICSKYPASCHGTSTFNLHSCHPWIWSAAVKLLVCSLPSFNRFISHSVHHKSGYLTVLITLFQIWISSSKNALQDFPKLCTFLPLAVRSAIAHLRMLMEC